MKKILNSGLVLTLLVLGSLSAFAQTIYITDANGNFGDVNLSTDTVTVLGNSGIILHDIGFTSNGNLYAETSTALYSMNVNNGAVTYVGSFGGLGLGAMVGLTGYGTGLIAASDYTNQLFSVDVSPFSVKAFTGTLNGATNGDLTFAANGALYDFLTNGNLDKVTVSGTTISSKVIGNSGYKAISGMASDAAGQVFAISGTEIWLVDLNTAALTPYFNYAGHGLGTVYGAASYYPGLAVVPEPGNVALLLAGLAALLVYQKRRNSLNQG